VIGTALDLLGAAFGVVFDDAEHLEKAMPLYDGVYEHCRIRELSGDVLASAPLVPPLRVPYLRDALRRTHPVRLSSREDSEEAQS
jgi:hypothetical protein